MGVKWIWEISFRGTPNAIDQLLKSIHAKYSHWKPIDDWDSFENKIVCFKVEGKETEEDIKRMLEELLYLFAIEAKVRGYLEDREPDASFTVKGGELDDRQEENQGKNRAV